MHQDYTFINFSFRSCITLLFPSHVTKDQRKNNRKKQTKKEKEKSRKIKKKKLEKKTVQHFRTKCE